MAYYACSQLNYGNYPTLVTSIIKDLLFSIQEFDFIINYNCDYLQERTQAACIIQSAAVKFLWRRRQEKKAIAAVIIQVAWRDHVARKKARERELEQLYILQNAAATVIQVYFECLILWHYL